MKWLLLQTYLWAGIYFSATALLHFRFKIDIQWLLYLTGAIIGLHLLEYVDYLVKQSPSPFRTVHAYIAVSIVTLFVLTSSRTSLGAGVVLFLNLYFYLSVRQEFLEKGTLVSWFRLPFKDTIQNTPVAIVQPVDSATFKNYSNLMLLLLCIETLIFVLI